MYALVEIKGKQYRVQEGSRLVVDLFENSQERVELDRVLLLSSEDEVRIGKPYVENARVTLRIDGQTSGPKLRIFKYKRRKNYRRTQGHRQKYSTAVVESIHTGS